MTFARHEVDICLVEFSRGPHFEFGFSRLQIGASNYEWLHQFDHVIWFGDFDYHVFADGGSGDVVRVTFSAPCDYKFSSILYTMSRRIFLSLCYHLEYDGILWLLSYGLKLCECGYSILYFNEHVTRC